jgi:hypothetical protein
MECREYPEMSSRIVRRAIISAALCVLLAGCASDPRFKEGVAWVEYNEAEKARLNAQGFPQYSHY